MDGFYFITAEPVTKGWSEDKKYCVTKPDGEKYLLRISPISRYESRRTLFDMLKRVDKLDIPMCRPVEFGTCPDGVYALQSWIDGGEAEEIIPALSDTEQYAYGVKAGEILRKLHSIPAPEDQEDWETRFNRKIDRKIREYSDCPIKYDGGDAFVDYINSNRGLLHGRPQCFQHGDYHIGNMMIRRGELVIIDFDRFDFGDPWEEFNRIVWCAQKAPPFASGMVDGYFGGEPPLEFWRLLALYIASNTLSSVPWAIRFGQREVDTMQSQAREVLGWYDDMKKTIPAWYSGGYCLQYADGLPYRLRSPFDFSFLGGLGRVFKVFDDQDSGNICFGVESNCGGGWRFVKFAGAPSARYDGYPADAVAALRSAGEVYRELTHPNLIRLREARAVGGGYALVFDWTDGACMGRQYPESHRKIMALPISEKLRIYRAILDFHAHVAACGWVAVDFYDGSVLYDAASGETLICDIDFYARRPYINRMGRMWGSSRFMSPEEYKLGAEIDEVTNVYTMGAAAFALFCDSDRLRAAWPLGEAAYDVVSRAVSECRAERQQSIRKLIAEWESAVTL